MENDYSCRDSEASIEALGSFQIIITYSGTAINPRRNWQDIIGCNWVWVPEHMGIEPALGLSTKVARGVTRDWTSGEYEEYWQSISGRTQLRGF